MNYFIVLLIMLIFFFYVIKFDILVLTAHKFYSIFHNYIIESQHQIIKNLWLGDRYSPVDKLFIKKNNIKLVINCTKDIIYNLHNVDIMRIPIDDNRSDQSNLIMTQYFNKYYDKVDNYLNKNNGVLVHCYSGCQRSATFICLFLMKKFKLDYQSCKRKIISKRFLAFFPFVNFHKILIK